MLDAMPASPTAESELIGLALVEGRIPVGAEIVSADDFYNHRNKQIWAAVMALDAEGGEIDAISVSSTVAKNGGAIPVSEVAQFVTGSPLGGYNPKRAVEEITETSRRRAAVKVLHGLVKGLSQGTAKVADIAEAISSLEGDTLPTGKFRHIDDIIDHDVKPSLADLKFGRSRKISTGFDQVDQTIGGGIAQGEVMVLTADTGGGKSALALQIAVQIAQNQHPVAYLSGEMSDRENLMRILSRVAKTWNLNSATHLYEDQYQNLLAWSDSLKGIPLWFESRTFDLPSLRRSLRGLVNKYGIEVVVVDYLQLYKTGTAAKRVERIAEASDEVKRIAAEFNVAVIEVVQLNRTGAKSDKAGLHDLEGSGQLEKNASIVAIIDREENSDNVTLRIVKGRNASKGEVFGRFEGVFLNFEF